jgi:hypothetical protein
MLYLKKIRGPEYTSHEATEAGKNGDGRTLSWTAPGWVRCSSFEQRCDFNLEIRVFRVIRGQKHDRIFTTDSTDNTDESKGLQKGGSIPEGINVFHLLDHPGRSTGTSNLALSN